MELASADVTAPLFVPGFLGGGVLAG